ncbi:MAG: cysteine desulfurase [Methanomicrobiales archaeon]|nr:cysteine desulfurase [Methanomicrobiales archaeon]
MEGLKGDFPVLMDLIYLDSASTSLSPEPVLGAMLDFEHSCRANVGRGVHGLSRIATERYHEAHLKLASFIGADEGEVVLVRNSTEAINMVASGLEWNPGDRIISTIMEHHSNLLPWMRLRRRGVELDLIGIRGDLTIDLEALGDRIDGKTRLVALTHASNVTGVVNPVREMAEVCHDHGALLLVDGAQSVPHLRTDVSSLGCDFLCFSGHKMLGPTGTGALWMREPLLEPLLLGGGVIERVTRNDYSLLEGYQRFEAGTPNIGGAIGLAAAIDYLERIGMHRMESDEQQMRRRMIEGLRRIGDVVLHVPPDSIPAIGVVSFTVRGRDPNEVALLLDSRAGIMVRSGHHCCMPLMDTLGLDSGTVRASLYLYNDMSDVDALLAAIGEIAGG